MALLRIGATDLKLAQMLYQPGSAHPAPGYGFILLFERTELRDGQNKLLAKGTITARIRPEVVGPVTLAMLTRLLSPFQGYFVLLVDGVAQIDATGTSAEVLGDAIVGSNVQPT